MTVFEIVLCCSLLVNLYLAWRVYEIDQDLDELGQFSVGSVLTLSKKLERLEDERDKNTRRGYERGDQG